MTRSNIAVREGIPAEITSASSPEQRMRDGKRLILAGFVIAVLGIVAYCVAGLSAPIEAGRTSGLGAFVVPSLCIIGLGTLLWLIGSIRFLRGSMDSREDTSALDL
jgi:uncharacterized membrane protein